MDELEQLIAEGREQRINYGMEVTLAVAEKSLTTPLMAQNDDAIIKTELQEKDAKVGMGVVMGMLAPLSGDGVSGNTDFEANRDKMEYLNQSVVYDSFGNSVKSDNTKITARTIGKFREDAKRNLSEWGHKTLDRKVISRLAQDCTNIVACKSDGVYQSNVTTSITTGDVMNTKAIDEMIRRAETMKDGNGNIHPGVRSIYTKVGKSPHSGAPVFVHSYLLLLGSHGIAQLQDDPVWVDHQKQLIRAMGQQAPIFTGEIGQYKGVYVVDFKTWNAQRAGMPTSDLGGYKGVDFDKYKGASGKATEIGLFLGATAGLCPQDDGFEWYENKADEGRKMTIAIDRGLAFAKTKYVGQTAEQQKLLWHGKDYSTTAVVYSKE